VLSIEEEHKMQTLTKNEQWSEKRRHACHNSIVRFKFSIVKFQISSCCTRVIVERSPNPSTLALKWRKNYIYQKYDLMKIIGIKVGNLLELLYPKFFWHKFEIIFALFYPNNWNQVSTSQGDLIFVMFILTTIFLHATW
jgi:hypothetical protein